MVFTLKHLRVLTVATVIALLCLPSHGGEPTLPASDLEVAELDLDERIQAARNALAEAKKQYQDDIAKAEMVLRAAYDNTIQSLNEQDPKLAAELSQERDAVMKNVKVPEKSVVKKKPAAKDAQEDDGFGKWEELTAATGVLRVVVYRKKLTPDSPKDLSKLLGDHEAGSLMKTLGGAIAQKEKGVFKVPVEISTFYVPVLLRPRANGKVRISFGGEKPYRTTQVEAKFDGLPISDGATVPVKKDARHVLLLDVRVNDTHEDRCWFTFDVTDEKGVGIEVHVP